MVRTAGTATCHISAMTMWAQSGPQWQCAGDAVCSSKCLHVVITTWNGTNFSIGAIPGSMTT